jgi:hypothetical protein
MAFAHPIPIVLICWQLNGRKKVPQSDVAQCPLEHIPSSFTEPPHPITSPFHCISSFPGVLSCTGVIVIPLASALDVFLVVLVSVDFR